MPFGTRFIAGPLCVMKSTTKYSYKLRPGFGSKELLLDFDCNGRPDSLQNDLFKLLEDANFTITGVGDLWMNDQLLFEFKSQTKTVTITRDIWDLFFITAENNQSAITKLDELLSDHPLFEKMEVDFSEYE